MASRFYHYSTSALEKNKGKIRIDELLKEVKEFVDDETKTFTNFFSRKKAALFQLLLIYIYRYYIDKRNLFK